MEGSDRGYTDEQQALANKIAACKNYYEALSVSQNASLDEIKRAYKKVLFLFRWPLNSIPIRTRPLKHKKLSD